jgi:four helix bundle protein
MSVPESIQDRTFRYAVDILRFYRQITRSTDLPRHLSYQVLRAGTSIGANSEEARSAYSRRDLAARYTIALRESRECRFWLRLILVDQPQLADTTGAYIQEAGELVGILTATVRKLRES